MVWYHTMNQLQKVKGGVKATGSILLSLIGVYDCPPSLLRLGARVAY